MATEVWYVPVYYSLFSRPGPVIVHTLKASRERMELPQLADGLEEVPGAWGLRTPGYYILALHFRAIPIGFEPMALDLPDRTPQLPKFWKTAAEAAEKAAAIAECRGLKLLIYFATGHDSKLT